MPRHKMEEKMQYDPMNFDIDDSPLPEVEVKEPEQTEEKPPNNSGYRRRREIENDEMPVSCLRKERVIVRYIPKQSGIWGVNPKHILAGGMAERATRTFTVPRLSSGKLVNVLTNSEKAFLEEMMGLDKNALSIYNPNNNFWDGSNESGIYKVTLNKQDNYLDLSDPEDYIRYKILLANKDYIAPSLQVLQDYPRATYQFVIISDGEETKQAKVNMSATMQCYKEYGKIEDDLDTLRVVVETIEGRPTSQSSKLELLQTKVNDLIQMDSKLFLKVITDPMLKTKVLIKKCIEAGLISNRGGFLYLRSDNTPLCENGEEPTLNIAAKYLNSPKRQEIKFNLEAKLKAV